MKYIIRLTGKHIWSIALLCLLVIALTLAGVVQALAMAKFLDLASAPYGFDTKELTDLGAKCMVAPALPTKYAPKSSGYAIGRAVCRLCSELEI